MIYGNKIGGNSIDDKIYVVESNGVEALGVIVDDPSVPELTACCEDVLVGKWFVGKNGLEQGTNDSPCCRVTSGVHEVYPGVEYMLCIPQKDQWDYTTLHGVITSKNNPYKVDNLIADCAVYDETGYKISDITRDPNTCSIRFNMTNDTADIKLLQFFICKEEHNV